MHRYLHSEVSVRPTLYQSYHGSGVHHHWREGQRVLDVCHTDSHFSTFCKICVFVSAAACVSYHMSVSPLQTVKETVVSYYFFFLDETVDLSSGVTRSRHFSPVCQTWYFSLDNTRATISGYCGKQSAVLSITMQDNAASLQFTFTKVENKPPNNKWHPVEIGF